MKAESSGEDPAGRAAEQDVRSPGQSYPDTRAMDRAPEPVKKKSRWKKALTLALTPAGAVGAGVMPHAGAGLPSSPRVSTVVPPGTSGHLGSGEEYPLQAGWERLAGREAARLATAVIDLANSRAGGQALGSGARRYLIQLVLTGAGGVDPGEAADVLELGTADEADLRLGTLISTIRHIHALAPQASEHPPESPGAGGVNRAEFSLAHMLLGDPGVAAPRPPSPTAHAGPSDD